MLLWQTKTGYGVTICVFWGLVETATACPAPVRRIVGIREIGRTDFSGYSVAVILRCGRTRPIHCYYLRILESYGLPSHAGFRRRGAPDGVPEHADLFQVESSGENPRGILLVQLLDLIEPMNAVPDHGSHNGTWRI